MLMKVGSLTPCPGVTRQDSLNTCKLRESQVVYAQHSTQPLALGSTQPFDLGRSPSPYLMVTLQVIVFLASAPVNGPSEPSIPGTYV